MYVLEFIEDEKEKGIGGNGAAEESGLLHHSFDVLFPRSGWLREVNVFDISHQERRMFQEIHRDYLMSPFVRRSLMLSRIVAKLRSEINVAQLPTRIYYIVKFRAAEFVS